MSFFLVLLMQVSWAGNSVPQKPENITPLKIGDTVSIATLNNTSKVLYQKVSEKPIVLIFYRGGWCPYCNVHLKELQGIEKDLTQKGYALIAVSPDKSSTLNAHKSKKSLHITMVSDSDMKLAQAFGVAFKVQKSMVKKYLDSYNIDIVRDSGKDHNLLPVPSVFVLNKSRVIQYVYTNANYKVRLSGVELLKALDAISPE
ncbi:MAG: AhpC/TSA family protein [Reichenbachiella sp.]